MGSSHSLGGSRVADRDRGEFKEYERDGDRGGIVESAGNGWRGDRDGTLDWTETAREWRGLVPLQSRPQFSAR